MTARRLLPPARPQLQPDISLFIVNIVLLMILFFLATGQIMSGTPVEERLALTRELPLDQLPSPLVEIGPNGTFTVNGEPVEELDLASSIGEADTIYILIDRTAEATTLVQVLSRPDLSPFDVELVTIAAGSNEVAR